MASDAEWLIAMLVRLCNANPRKTVDSEIQPSQAVGAASHGVPRHWQHAPHLVPGRKVQ